MHYISIKLLATYVIFNFYKTENFLVGGGDNFEKKTTSGSVERFYFQNIISDVFPLKS